MIFFKTFRLEKQINILNEFARSLAKPAVNGLKDDVIITSSSKESVNNFLEFIDVYGNKNEDLDNQKFQIGQEIEKNTEKLNVARDNLNRLNFNNYNDTV